MLDKIQFYIDDELIGQVIPPLAGFWELGGFQGNNIWINGTILAPFDQNVISGILCLFKFDIYLKIKMMIPTFCVELVSLRTQRCCRRKHVSR